MYCAHRRVSERWLRSYRQKGNAYDQCACKTKYNDNANASAAIDADELDAFNTATGLGISADDITYEGVDNNYGGTSAPTNAGKYKAMIGVDTIIAYVEYEIAKAEPAYTVPTGLSGQCGSTVGDIQLPEHFAWSSPDTPIKEIGDNSFTLVYTPENTANFNIVDGITVNVTGIAVYYEAILPTCEEGGLIEHWAAVICA